MFILLWKKKTHVQFIHTQSKKLAQNLRTDKAVMKNGKRYIQPALAKLANVPEQECESKRRREWHHSRL